MVVLLLGLWLLLGCDNMKSCFSSSLTLLSINVTINADSLLVSALLVTTIDGAGLSDIEKLHWKITAGGG